MPFWDQWDAEGDWLLRPWVEGHFKMSDLWFPQNEHRLVPSHILTLLLFEVTGTWSNLTEARVNIVLGALTPLLLIWLLHRWGEIYKWRWLVVAVTICGAILPFAWENILFGFQSQFYFLCIFTLSALILASTRPYHAASVSAIVVISILSVLTMASGLLTPVAVAAVYSLHWLMAKKKHLQTIIIIVVLAGITVTAYLTMPYNPGHDFLHAQNFAEFSKALIRVLGWPLTARKLITIVFWLPSAAILITFLVKKKLSRTDVLMSGCFIWSALQAVAIAYGRGHEPGDVLSRYTDLLSLGLAGSAWFIVRATEVFNPVGRFRYTFKIIAILFFAAFFVSHKKRFRPGINSMKKSKELRTIQETNVYGYLRTGDAHYLQQGNIPYPDANRLQMLLDNQGIRQALPPKSRKSAE